MSAIPFQPGHRTVRGGRKQRQANEASKEAGAQTAVHQQQQAYGQRKAAYNQRLSTLNADSLPEWMPAAIQ